MKLMIILFYKSKCISKSCINPPAYKLLTYSPIEIKYLYLKSEYNTSIRTSYNNLKNDTNLNINQINFLQKQFLKNNFRTI